jgi:cation transport ATPase
MAPTVAVAQEQKCEGPKELCAQILELKAKLDAQKAEKEKVSAEKDTANAEKDKANAEKDTAKAEKDSAKLEAEKKDAENVARMIAFAAILAILLKSLVSALQSWKGFFTTDKQKAWLKIITLVVGFAAFLLSNIGFGIPWWQSIILAGGGPGAIMVHELMKLIPVLLGKKKYESKSEPPAPTDEAKKEADELADKLEPPKP